MSVQASSRRRGSVLAEHVVSGSFSKREEITCGNSITTSAPKPTRVPINSSIDSKRIVPIIDVSNVVRNGSQEARLARLVNMLDTFSAINLKSICIADANLWHYVDQQESYEEMLDTSTILQAPAGTTADTFILSTAKMLSTKGALPLVVTNDRLLGESARSSGSVKFLFVPWEKEEFLLFEPALEKLSLGVR